MDSLNVFSELKKCVPENQIFLNEPMCKHTTFKIGGPAKFFVKVKKIEEVRDVVKFAKLYGMEFCVIGQGSNILVSDEGFDGIVIKMELDGLKIIEESKTEELDERQVEVVVDAGVKLGFLAQKLCMNGIAGFEFASGIPGTIGGAIKMNAGAYGREMKDIVVSTQYMDLDGDVYEFSNEENEFGYRFSRFFKENLIILSAKLILKKGNVDDIQRKMKEYQEVRKEKQPYDMPSAGSTFKRGEDFITAKLIDECGLKGMSVGGAEISTKHAGFIVNKGNATADDVLKLIEKVKKTVKDKTNKEIQLEIELIGIKESKI